MPALRVAQRTTVAEHTVEPVVDPLRDPEELGVAVDHDPTRFDAIVEEVPQARPKELRDPTALGRRVHLPDGPTVEGPPRVRETPFVAAAGLRPRDRPEAPCGPRVNGDLVHPEPQPSPSVLVVRSNRLEPDPSVDDHGAVR